MWQFGMKAGLQPSPRQGEWHRVAVGVCVVYRNLFFYGYGMGWPCSASMDGLAVPAFTGWVAGSATAHVP